MMTAYRPSTPVPRAWPPDDLTGRRSELTIQHLGFEASALDTLSAALDRVGRGLGVDLRVDGASGDVVLADSAFLASVAPRVLNAFLEGRPLLTLDDQMQAPQELHAELARQLSSLVRGHGAAPPAVHGETPFLDRLRRGLEVPDGAPITATYGAGAVLRVDFAASIVRIDALAERRLRVDEKLPHLDSGTKPGPLARELALDRIVWSVGMAAGRFRPVDAPRDWWNAPLTLQPHHDMTRYTLRPSHLQLARWLARAPMAPADLHRQGCIERADLCGFLQAGLFTGILRWLAKPQGNAR